jgi:hypothetical protein
MIAEEGSTAITSNGPFLGHANPGGAMLAWESPHPRFQDSKKSLNHRRQALVFNALHLEKINKL